MNCSLKIGNKKEQGLKNGRYLFPLFREDSISITLGAQFYAELSQFLQQDWTPYALSVLLVKIRLTFSKSMYLGNFCGFYLLLRALRIDMIRISCNCEEEFTQEKIDKIQSTILCTHHKNGI